MLPSLARLSVSHLDTEVLSLRADPVPTEVKYKAELLKKVRSGVMALDILSRDARGDREVVLAAVERDGRALRYASEELRGNREVVLAAVQKDGWALEYASNALQGDREVVLAAVKQDGEALQHASEELRGDPEVVLAAVKQDGEALQHASEERQGDREVVLAAVARNGDALQYADSALRDDEEMLFAAATAEADNDAELLLGVVDSTVKYLAETLFAEGVVEEDVDCDEIDRYWPKLLTLQSAIERTLQRTISDYYVSDDSDDEFADERTLYTKLLEARELLDEIVPAMGDIDRNPCIARMLRAYGAGGRGEKRTNSDDNEVDSEAQKRLRTAAMAKVAARIRALPVR